MRTLVGFILGLVVGILMAACGVGGYLFMSTSSSVAAIPTTPTGQADVAIAVSESYINQQMQASLKKQGLAISNPTLDLHAPNLATASGDFTFQVLGIPITVRPTINMHFVVNNGKVTFEIDQVDVSGFTIPQDLVNAQAANFKQVAEAELNAQVQDALKGSGLNVLSVEATETALVVKLGQ